jgi:hypothetical protein
LRLDVPLEVPVMIPGVHIQPIASFVDVNQGHDVRPAALVDGADVRDFLRAEKCARVVIGHQTPEPMHVASRIGSSDVLQHAPY